MKRAIVSHRRARRAANAERAESVKHDIASLVAGAHASAPSSDGKAAPGRRVAFVDGDSAQLKEMQAKGGSDLIVEPVRHRGHEPVHPRFARQSPALTAQKAAPKAEPKKAEAEMDVAVKGSDKGVAGVNVTLVLEPPTVLNQTTSGHGTCRFKYDNSTLTPSSLSTSPIINYWTVAQVSPQQPATLNLPSIELNGPLAWWHTALGVTTYDEKRGAGIRVGIIDTGVGPNACLSHVNVIGSIINGHFDPKGGNDVDYHGTEIAGLIAARPRSPKEIAGVSPGVTVFAIRVFTLEGGANQADVAAAIDMLVDHYQVDLINLSLTGTEDSELERDAIAYAYEKGTLCICAAGNTAGPISFPASYPHAVSVSALGKVGWGPPGSIASQMPAASPDQSGRDGLYLAPFSNRGQGLDCCAPGLGILSTFPSKSAQESAWGEDSGTSLSTPLALSTLAAILAGSQEYMKAPRDETRSALAMRLLTEACQSIGINAEYQGKGVPTLKKK